MSDLSITQTELDVGLGRIMPHGPTEADLDISHCLIQGDATWHAQTRRC